MDTEETKMVTEEIKMDTEEVKAPIRTIEAAKGIVAPEEYPGVDFCVMIDCTGSMASYINMSRDKIKDIIKQVKELYSKSEIRIGAVGYRDFNDPNMLEVFPFQEDADKARNFFDKLVATGGGDTPENVNGAFQKALYELEWKNPVRIIVHIADAPCHGKEFHTCDDSYPNGGKGDKPWDQMFKDLVANHIDYTFFKISNITDKMFEKFKKMALAHGAEKFECIQMNISATTGGLFGGLGGGFGTTATEEKFAALISDDIKLSLEKFIKKRKLEKKTGDFFITKLGMSSTELLTKFREFNAQLLDKKVDIEEKKQIIEKIKDYMAGSLESSSLAIKCGLFFGLAVLSKNVKTDEKTLEGILQILANLTAGNTEDYTILTNEGAQELVIENLDKTLPDNICEGAIWNVANLAVESAQATELMVKISCFDRVIDVYLAKLDSKLALLTSTTAWCVACFLHHNSLDEENRLKLIPVLKGMLEKEITDKDTFNYISYTFNALLTSSRKVVEEMDKAKIFTTVKDGFLKLDAKTPADLKLAFYKGLIEGMIDDKDSYDVLLPYLTDEAFLARLCTYSFELVLRAAQKLAKPLSLLFYSSKEAVNKFNAVPQGYDKLYQKLREDNNNASPYIKILKILVAKGNEKVHENVYIKENQANCDYLRTIVRALPTAAADYEIMLDFIKGLIAILKLAQAKKPDTITNGVKGAVFEHRNLVKNFLDKQKDPEVSTEVKNLYDLLAIKKEEKKETGKKKDKIVDEKEEKKSSKKKSETKKDAKKSEDKLKENLSDEEDLPNPLKRKLKRMTTMAQTALDAAEFLDKAELNLRKTRQQTKKAAEEEKEASAKKGKKKVSKKKEIKISKAIPDHPAIRRTKTMIETIAAAKAFLKSNEKGKSAIASLRSATRAAKTLRRTRTMKEIIEGNKGLGKKYGRGMREKEDVDYSELFRKKVRK